MSFGSYDPNKQSTRQNRGKKFYLKDGSNLYRVLPPAKSLKDKNKIAQFVSVIWLTDTKNKKRPVASILRTQNKQIVQSDPLLNRLEEMKAALSQALANNENPTVVTTLKENLKRIRHNKGYAMNVISAGGEVGVLEIPYTAYQGLENRIRELNAKGIDAIGIGSDKGLFFDFKKLKDERGKTVYTVDTATKTVKDATGNFGIQYIRAPLTVEEATTIGEQVEDLTKLYRELSIQEMEALATLDQRVFDAIFAKATPAQEEAEGPVDDDTQNDLTQYMGTTQTQVGQNPLTAMQAPVQQQVNPQQVYQQQPMQTVGYMQTQPLPNTPVAPQYQQTGFGGNVADNNKVKNFLFPDQNKKG